MNHSIHPEPWSLLDVREGIVRIIDANGLEVSPCCLKEPAQRIVAVVNACKYIPAEDLPRIEKLSERWAAIKETIRLMEGNP